MSSQTTTLNDYTSKTVSVLTSDGRTLVGTLTGFDQYQNLILTSCHERVWSEDRAVELVDLGVYVVRGDGVAVVGELDEEAEAKRDLEKERSEGIKPIIHTNL